MSLQQWFRPPRHLLVLFLGTTLALLVGLGWIGWLAISNLENDERVAAQERLEEAAGTLAAALKLKLTELESQLASLSLLRADVLATQAAAFSRTLGEDTVLAVFERDTVTVFPPSRLLYYPVLPEQEPYIYTVMPGNRRPSGESGALTELRYLEKAAASENARIRAEALLALAALHKNSGRDDAALATYARLRDPAVLVDGRPAELIARESRCELLAERGRATELGREARELYDDLHQARWRLTRNMFETSAKRARSWLGNDAAAEAHAIESALSDGIGELWDDLRYARHGAEPFQTTSPVLRGHPVLLTGRGTQDRAVVFAAGRKFLQRLVAQLGGQDGSRSVHVGLVSVDGPEVVSAGVTSDDQEPVSLSPDNTQLPWTLRAVSTGPMLDEAARTRKRLVIGGLPLIALIVAAASYFSARAMTRELNAARLQSDFVAAVSHEFRTPLTLLRQFSDLLADDRVSSDDERRMYYAALQRGTRRLTRLVEDLLDFARMEAGSHAFRLEPVRASEWLTRLVAEFAGEIRSKGYRVEFAWRGSDATMVRADESALTRAVWNLLDNAVKYSPDCKQIWVEGRASPDGVWVSVRDRGLGVPPSERRAIFGKFVRGSLARGDVVKGTGLGLALVEQIVEAHSGTVHLESKEGEGSTFTIRLPVHVAEQVA